MANSVKFKYGATIEGKDLSSAENQDAFVAVNKGMDNVGNSKYGSIYKGDKILGTTEANNLVLTSDIVIAGGPLEADGKTAFGSTIPAGTSLQDIMMKLFCVEKWPVKTNGTTNVSTSGATLVSTVSTPSLTYNGKTANNNSTTVEVGTTVSYEAKSGASSYTATPHKASGFTYGYSAADDNTKDSSDTSKSAAFGTISAVSTAVPTLTLSGKVAETINGTAGSASTGAATKSGSVVIAEGDNKIKAQSKSITYTGTCSALAQLYGCSNLNNTHKADGTTYTSTAKEEVTLTSTAVNSGTIEINCVGAYKVFVGYVAEVPTTSAGVRAMSANSRLGKGSCGTKDEVYTISDNYMVVAVPAGWNFTIQNDLGQADQRNSFEKVGTVDVELPNHTAENAAKKTYDIWSIGWNGGAYKNLVII
jgi:hypothetical protein